MRPESKMARLYARSDRIIQAIEARLALPGCRGYHPDAMTRRTVQAISFQFLDSFMQAAAARAEGGPDQSEGVLDCGGLTIDLRTGSVTPHGRLWLACVAKFIALWALTFVYFLRPMGRAGHASGAVLIHGVPDADLARGGNSGRFEEYCLKGPLEATTCAELYFVQSVRPIVAQNPQRFIYTRHPLLYLFGQARIGIADAARFVSSHGQTLFSFLALSLRHPIACLLWRDFASHSAAESLNRRNLIRSNIITNTNWLQQFLWMSDLPHRRYKTYMALYSLNSSTIVVREDPVDAPHPGLRHLRADVIYIWNAEYEQTLRRDGVCCPTEITGPVLWYLSNETPVTPESNHYRIGLFDVTPMRDEVLKARGMAGSYYSTATMKLFLADVLDAAEKVSAIAGTRPEVMLKHKRKPNAFHDPDYFSCVARLRDGGELRLVEEDADLIEFIGACNLVIVIPFSSPAYIARHLGIPCLFYDPVSSVLSREPEDHLFGFVSGREDLLGKMKEFAAMRHALNSKAPQVPYAGS